MIQRSTAVFFFARAISALALAATPALAGDLTPPGGSVAPTMKTLDQLRPGTPLSDVPPGPASAHLITEPGTYYLTEELAVGLGQTGIEISLDGLPPGEYYVCIDFAGHPIRMQPGSIDGIHYTDNVGHEETIEICVGYSEDYLGHIIGAGDDGIDVNGAAHLRVRNMRITNSGDDAIHATTHGICEWEDITLVGAGGDGIDAAGTMPPEYIKVKMTNVIISGITGDGVRVVDTQETQCSGLTITGAGGNGLVLRPSVAPGSTARAFAVVSDAKISSSGIDGVVIEPQTPGSYAFDLRAMDSAANTGDGLSVRTSITVEDLLIDCREMTTSRNGGSGVHVFPVGGGVSDHCIVQMTDCSATSNSDHGVHFNWTQVGGPFQFDIKDSSLSHNTNDGLRAIAADGCGKDNDCNSNGGRGTVATGKIEVDGGTFNNNGAGGIRSENSSCWIRVAQCSGNTGHGVEAIESNLSIDGGLFASNTGDGIYAEDADATIARCTSRGNGGNGATLAGITADRKSMLEWYKAMQNTGSGLVIQRANALVVSNCSTTGNGSYGIWCQNFVSNGSLVDNHCNGDAGGIRVDGANNVIQRNTVTFGQLGGITAAAGNVVGMPVDAGNIATHSNPAANVER